MEYSTIFYNYVTDIDCAYIDAEGRAKGLSFAPRFRVGGSITEEEQVVADFSSCKKQLKGAMDNGANGIDHKLLVFTRFSNAKIFTSKTEGNVIVETPFMTLDVPLNSVRTIVQAENETHTAALQKEIERVCSIHTKLNVTVPDMNLNSIVNTFQDCFVRLNFCYTHGLTKSSSYGCKNIMHGHSSYLEVSARNSMKYAVQEHIKKIANDLNGAYIACSDHVEYVTVDGQECVLVSYENERGKWGALLKDMIVITMDCEPTIENIAATIADWYSTELAEIGPCELRVSEGLNKGAVIVLP